MSRANLWKTYKDKKHRRRVGRPRLLDEIRLMHKADELLNVEEELDQCYLYARKTPNQIVTLQLSPNISRILTRE